MPVGKDRLSWLDELAPTSILWPDGRKLKLQYAERPHDKADQPAPPELQIKLHDCFALKAHPAVCEGRQPIKLWLCSPEGKRLQATCNWLTFKALEYPKLKPGLQKKYPGVAWV